jgi:probable F420-dependent oxidoreductase
MLVYKDALGAPDDSQCHRFAEAERSGYDGIWAAETRHDPFLTAMAAASATSRIEVGTGVAIAFARNPMSLAVLANDLQLASGGRFILGLGTQVQQHITRRFSMTWTRPVARMRELVLAINAIWESWRTDERLDFHGEFYTHDLMTPFFSPGPNKYDNPPIYLAAVGTRMTEMAGEVADGLMVHGFTTERYFREVTLPALRRGRAKGAKTEPMALAGVPFIVTGRTDEQVAHAKHYVKSRIAFYASTPAYLPVLQLHGWENIHDELRQLARAGQWSSMTHLVDDDMLQAFAIVAEPDDVPAALHKRFGDGMHRICLHLPRGVDEADTDMLRAQIQRGTAAIPHPSATTEERATQ